MPEVTVDEAEYEFPRLYVGDHVRDRESDDEETLLVVGIPGGVASGYTIGGGETVADYNLDYPEDDEVVEVVYPQRTHSGIPTDTYAFPRTRLERIAAVHDVDDEGGGA